ncbi:TetR/AcrR family transcriptional regulator C-terminal domain-containing protein [Nonomuraea angiospora]|uniref:TetR/AcrR family transcriptional regulator C-terminal domain-containing protein n=1 Tax=Nonomuraea angiospora TaxID=46172 RepID=UPI0033CF64AD
MLSITSTSVLRHSTTRISQRRESRACIRPSQAPSTSSSLCEHCTHEGRACATRWRESLGDYCRELRGWYRSHRGMLALARTEDLTYLVAPGHLRADDALVGFFLDVGLAPQDAYRAWTITVLQIAGFAEVWDSWHDHPPGGADPASWTGLPASAELPHLRRLAGEAAAEPPDELFESVIAMLTSGIAAMAG